MAGGNIGQVAHWLVIIGALNWGLTGLGGFVGSDLNVLKLILGSIPVVENLVYVLVGLGAVWMLKEQFMK